MNTQSLTTLSPQPPYHLRRDPRQAWRVLVVDHDSRHQESLSEALRIHGYEVNGTGTGKGALSMHHEADFILLSIDLPDRDGLEVCREIRSSSDTPVVAMSAQATELDRVLGLHAGADDYLSRPYGLRELLARMEAVKRRARPSAPAASAVVMQGPLRVNAASRTVTVDGSCVELTRKEFDLLHLLAQHPDTVISRQEVMNQVWEDSWSRRTVDTHVATLRSKLGHSSWIVTVRGVGFKLGQGPANGGVSDGKVDVRPVCALPPAPR